MPPSKPTNQRWDSDELQSVVIVADTIMKALRSLASVLAIITGFTATSAAPTPRIGSDHAPMPTELHGSRNETYLATSRKWPSGSAGIGARLYVVCGIVMFEGPLKCTRHFHYRAQNIDPDKVPSPTGTSNVVTLDISETGIGAEPPAASGSKWIWVLVPNTQGRLGFWIELLVGSYIPGCHSELGQQHDRWIRHEA